MPGSSRSITCVHECVSAGKEEEKSDTQEAIIHFVFSRFKDAMYLCTNLLCQIDCITSQSLSGLRDFAQLVAHDVDATLEAHVVAVEGYLTSTRLDTVGGFIFLKRSMLSPYLSWLDLSETRVGLCASFRRKKTCTNRRKSAGRQ